MKGRRFLSGEASIVPCLKMERVASSSFDEAHKLALRNDSALCACHTPRKQLNLGIIPCIERGLQGWIHVALHDMP